MLPLEGITVVAIEQAVAAPFATSKFADAGAKVFKIERPEGDFARGYDDVAKGQSSYFVWLNRGKDAVTLDLGSDKGKEALEALIRRGVTAQGADISVSIFDVMADWLTVPLLNHEGGKSPKRIGLAHPSIAPYGAFQPKSGSAILIAIQSDREWRMLCRDFIGDEALASDPRFATNVARVNNRTETDTVVAAAFSKMDSAAALERLSVTGIALASVNDMAGLSQHPHLRRITVDSPNGPVSFPAPAARFVGEERNYGAVPALKPLEE